MYTGDKYEIDPTLSVNQATHMLSITAATDEHERCLYYRTHPTDNVGGTANRIPDSISINTDNKVGLEYEGGDMKCTILIVEHDGSSLPGPLEASITITDVSRNFTATDHVMSNVSSRQGETSIRSGGVGGDYNLGDRWIPPLADIGASTTDRVLVDIFQMAYARYGSVTGQPFPDSFLETDFVNATTRTYSNVDSYEPVVFRDEIQKIYPRLMYVLAPFQPGATYSGGDPDEYKAAVTFSSITMTLQYTLSDENRGPFPTAVSYDKRGETLTISYSEPIEIPENLGQLLHQTIVLRGDSQACGTLTEDPPTLRDNDWQPAASSWDQSDDRRHITFDLDAADVDEIDELIASDDPPRLCQYARITFDITGLWVDDYGNAPYLGTLAMYVQLYLGEGSALVPHAAYAEWHSTLGRVTLYWSQPVNVTVSDPPPDDDDAIIHGPGGIHIPYSALADAVPGGTTTDDDNNTVISQGYATTLQHPRLTLNIPNPTGEWVWDGLTAENSNGVQNILTKVSHDAYQAGRITVLPPPYTAAINVLPDTGVQLNWTGAIPASFDIERQNHDEVWEIIETSSGYAYTDERPLVQPISHYRIWQDQDDDIDDIMQSECATIPVKKSLNATLLGLYPFCHAMLTGFGPDATILNLPDDLAAGALLNYTQYGITLEEDYYVVAAPFADTGSSTSLTVFLTVVPSSAPDDSGRLFTLGESCSVTKPVNAVCIDLMDDMTIQAYAAADGDSPAYYLASEALPLDESSVIALTVDGGRVTLYVNGTLTDSKFGDIQVPVNLEAAGLGAGLGYEGDIGGIAVYRSAFTSVEVRQHFEQGVDTGTLEIPPPTLESLSARTLTTDMVELNWDTPEYVFGHLLGYRIWYGTGDVADTTVASAATPSTTTFEVSDLDEGSYVFRVGAISPYGTGSSNIARADTRHSVFGVGELSVEGTPRGEPLPILIEPYDGSVPIEGDGGVADPNTDEVGTNNPAAGPGNVTLVQVIFDAENTLECTLTDSMSSDDAQEYTFAPGNEDIQIGDNGRAYIIFRYPNAGGTASLDCVEDETGESASYRITTDIPLLMAIQNFQNGVYGTDGSFGSLDIVFMSVITLSMIGFSRVNIGAGAIINVMVTGALAYFELITFPAAILGSIACIVVFAVVTTRRGS